MSIIADNIQQVRARIEQACLDAGRPVQSVTLVAVSKRFDAASVRAAYDAGLRSFGENQVQEAVDKVRALGDLRAGMEWHLIGPLQSNKTRLAAETFDWIHSIDRLKVALRLDEQRPRHLPPLQVCLQVNISGEATKSGLAPADVEPVATAVAALPNLRLRGLMAIPAAAVGFQAQRAPHRALRELQQSLVTAGLPLDTLSIGMSDDLEAAIAEGATLVRVGTAIFGSRVT
jgi:pyridoxal phosphate enzyme (YggS family)